METFSLRQVAEVLSQAKKEYIFEWLQKRNVAASMNDSKEMLIAKLNSYVESVQTVGEDQESRKETRDEEISTIGIGNMAADAEASPRPKALTPTRRIRDLGEEAVDEDVPKKKKLDGSDLRLPDFNFAGPTETLMQRVKKLEEFDDFTRDQMIIKEEMKNRYPVVKSKAFSETEMKSITKNVRNWATFVASAPRSSATRFWAQKGLQDAERNWYVALAKDKLGDRAEEIVPFLDKSTKLSDFTQALKSAGKVIEMEKKLGEKKEKSPKELTCYKCGEPGHLSSKCKGEKVQDPRRNRKGEGNSASTSPNQTA